jgi:MFS family permease
MHLSPSSVATAPSSKVARISTRVLFFIIGLGGAAWAPLVPFAKARNHLNEGQLGLLLLCLGVGSLVSMPLAGALAARYGCRRVILVATGLLCLALPLLALATPLTLLGPALFVFGAGVGAVDCVINIQAVLVERASGQHLMSGFHGFFSVGGMVGAGGMSALLLTGVSPLLATGVVVVVILGALSYAAPHLLADRGTGDSGPAFAWPRGPVVLIGGLCFVLFLTEGSILDWSAVFLTAERGVPPTLAGLGYAAFASTMMLGRFTGDALVRRFGKAKVLGLGGLLAAAGLALTTLVPSWPVSLVGYALVGAGCANSVPVLFSAVGRQRAMPEHLAVAAISTIGYAGILAGPALIGFLTQVTSFTVVFLLLAALLVGVAASSRTISH